MKQRKMKLVYTKTQEQEPSGVWNPLAGITPEQIAQADAEYEAEQQAKYGNLKVPTPFPDYDVS
jgi:hypothetical protein